MMRQLYYNATTWTCHVAPYPTGLPLQSLAASSVHETIIVWLFGWLQCVGELLCSLAEQSGTCLAEGALSNTAGNSIVAY